MPMKMAQPLTMWPALWRWPVLLYHVFALCCQGTPCDLVTGEERRYANEDGTASDHVACTVEMASVTVPCKFFPSLSFSVCVCMRL